MDIRQAIPTNYGYWIEKFGEAWKSQVEKLKEKFGNILEEVKMPVQHPTDVPILYVKKESIVEVGQFLRDTQEFEYNFLSDITATDEKDQGVKTRFEVVYNLFSTKHLWRIRIKVRVTEDDQVPTLIPVWKGANWAEREIYDMYGIKFQGHPDLRRILMDERWVGHPLRKDYPLKGYQIFTDAQPVNPKLLE
jgi:NADH-quinone oxidoreductase subunit C